ncbi:hypothetical protein [Streptomyces achromogenes]|uniref:hypothetical protein n=1 Tax=Streptomyces achromogenes TaxID=67255 RepID=UPI0027D77957|nr:hypothetical protein [Streptomyces achromogenes]
MAPESDGRAPTQKQAADRLKVSEPSLSRYLSAVYLPGIAIAKALLADAGGAEKAGITEAKLEELHSVAAFARQCDECVELRSEATVLQQQVGERVAEASAIRSELDSIRTELDSTRKETAILRKESVTLREESVTLRKENTAMRKETATLQEETATLRKENTALQEETANLKHGVQALKHGVQALKAREGRALKSTARRAIRAGQRSRQTARRDAAQLPVPPRRGDRQLSNPEKRAALSVALQAGALQNGGRQDRALSLLRHSAEVLSPAETATLMFVLRESQLDDLAGTLIHIYGRDNSDPDIMQAAARLHQHGAPDDAAALLQAALSTRTGRP